MIERLCIQANLPKPRVAIAETPMPNAFAMGRSPKTATVCATTGILELLDPAELEGVLGHELTHVANRDVMVMTIASFFASIAAFIVQLGFFFGGGFGGDDATTATRLHRRDPGLGRRLRVSFLLLQALSRYREFAADRGSAIITGRPSALISALMKISGSMQRDPAARPARRPRRAGRLLHLPAEGQADGGHAVLDAPAARGPDRGAAAARGPAPGHRP